MKRSAIMLGMLAVAAFAVAQAPSQPSQPSGAQGGVSKVRLNLVLPRLLRKVNDLHKPRHSRSSTPITPPW